MLRTLASLALLFSAASVCMAEPPLGTRITEIFHAERLPTAYVLDGSRTVRYQGRIDDQFERSVKRPQPSSNDLKDALRAVLAGKEVEHPFSKVVGCPINREVKKVSIKSE